MMAAPRRQHRHLWSSSASIASSARSAAAAWDVVYEAIQETLGRRVALKVLPMHGRIDAIQIAAVPA